MIVAACCCGVNPARVSALSGPYLTGSPCRTSTLSDACCRLLLPACRPRCRSPAMPWRRAADAALPSTVPDQPTGLPIRDPITPPSFSFSSLLLSLSLFSPLPLSPLQPTPQYRLSRRGILMGCTLGLIPQRESTQGVRSANPRMVAARRTWLNRFTRTSFFSCCLLVPWPLHGLQGTESASPSIEKVRRNVRPCAPNDS